MSDSLPTDLKYTPSHEWVKDNGDGTATVGITDHAQELLGDIVFVEVPEAGAEFDKEDACAVVESVKAASDIYAVVSGEIVEGNAALDDEPELVNSDCYAAGWIYTIKMSDASQLDSLLSADDYSAEIAD